MKISKIYTFSLVVGFLIYAGFSSGHTAGQSIEKEVDGRLIDIGYDAVDKIRVGDTIHFDFNLWDDKKSEKIAEFDRVWVRIAPSNGQGILFTGFLYRPDFLLTGMSYTFLNPGGYSVTARFLDKDGRTIAEVLFPIEVEGKNFSFSSSVVIAGMIGLIAGWLLAVSLKKKSKLLS